MTATRTTTYTASATALLAGWTNAATYHAGTAAGWIGLGVLALVASVWAALFLRPRARGRQREATPPTDEPSAPREAATARETAAPRGRHRRHRHA